LISSQLITKLSRREMDLNCSQLFLVVEVD